MSLMGESETWEDFWRLGSPEWNEESHFRKDEHWQKNEGKNEHVTFERQEEDERDMLRAKKGSDRNQERLGASKQGSDMVLLVFKRG